MSGGLTSKEIVHTHKNPIKAFGSFGKKLFLPEESEDSENTVDVRKTLDAIKTVLKTERVERRSDRIGAEWLAAKKLAKVTRRTGHMPAHMGCCIKGTLFLKPEEALFLLEMNRLELLLDGIPFSIEQGYAILLNRTGTTMAQYRVYQNLALRGFHIKRWPGKTRNKIKELNDDEDLTMKRFQKKKKRRMKIAGVPEIDPFENNMPYFIYTPDSAGKMEVKHGIQIQSGSNELWGGNISGGDYSLINAVSGMDAGSFYQLHYLDFDVKEDKKEEENK